MTIGSTKIIDRQAPGLEMKTRAVRGGIVTFAGQGIKFVLQMSSTMVLARLLTPRDFGLVAMVATVTGFVLIFKDLGLSAATVQKAEITQEQISTLFWINAGLSAILALLTVVLAPIIVWLYKEPKLFWITIALAGGFIFNGLSVQHQALMSRQMRFSALTSIDIVSAFGGIAVGIVCARAGFGYWSLVWMQLTTPLITLIGIWLVSGWRPGLPVRRSGVRTMLAFGGNLTGFSIVNYFSRNFDNILLGRYWGADTLGLYSKAYSLLLFPMGQITAPISAVAVPTLSRLQNDPERFRRYYLKAVKFIAYASMPLVVAMGVLSHEIILLVLGRQWLGAGPIFTVLAAAAILQPAASTVGWVYVSLGQTQRMLAWSYIATPFAIVSFALGLHWGGIGVAIGYSIYNFLLAYPELVFAFKNSPITAGDVLQITRNPFAISLLMGGVMIAARMCLRDQGPIPTVVLSLLAGGAAFLIFARLVKSAWEDVADIAGNAKYYLTAAAWQKT
ncbi:MAG: lipopolysaccharide biosynthesis protein [Elusimicrobiota bacterium]